MLFRSSLRKSMEHDDMTRAKYQASRFVSEQILYMFNYP